MQKTTLDEALKTVKQMLKESEYSFFVTHGPGGTIHTRLMQPFEPEADLTLWFGAAPGSRKVREVQESKEATVAVMHPQYGGYASLMGTAEIVTDMDKRRQYWRAHWTDIYPGGPENDEYVLIRFVPAKIELMQFAEEAQPRPYGLKPTVLESSGGRWSIG